MLRDMSSAKTPRFIVHDTLQSSAVPASGRALAERYMVFDTVEKTAYDYLSSKRAAADTARDLNRGIYGPLAS